MRSDDSWSDFGRAVEVNIMKTMYHITSQKNLSSILEHGLVPQYGFLSDMILEQHPGVYMFLEKEEVTYAM